MTLQQFQEEAMKALTPGTPENESFKKFQKDHTSFLLDLMENGGDWKSPKKDQPNWESADSFFSNSSPQLIEKYISFKKLVEAPPIHTPKYSSMEDAFNDPKNAKMYPDQIRELFHLDQNPPNPESQKHDYLIKELGDLVLKKDQEFPPVLRKTYFPLKPDQALQLVELAQEECVDMEGNHYQNLLDTALFMLKIRQSHLAAKMYQKGLY